MEAVFDRLFAQINGQIPTEPRSAQDVAKILDCIKVLHGQIDRADEQALRAASPRLHMLIMTMLSESSNDLASHTKTVSSQLYNDPFRFFFEILQNADDASYKKIEGLEPPTIVFNFRAHSIEISTNEDGFLRQDVLAICSTGKSSKKTNTTSTGEKGFGFKAVFGVASDVHVQSGVWSFGFVHNSSEAGLGMVTPMLRPNTAVWTNGLSRTGTRSTLYYSAEGVNSRLDMYEKIRQLPVDTTAFLKKIKKIKIVIEDPQHRHQIDLENCGHPNPAYRCLTSTINGRQTRCFYRSIEKTFTGFPPRENRLGDRSTVAVWLPVQNVASELPIVSEEGHFVFACLPICQVSQIKFLIQADFELLGSRQDISNTPFNSALRNCVAKLFTDLVEECVAHRTGLSHTWMRFLPTSYVTGFWCEFEGLMKGFLRKRKIFYSTSDRLHELDDISCLPKTFLHEGEPILAAGPNRAHLSLSYSGKDVEILRNMGLTELDYSEQVDCLRRDLGSNQSRMRSTTLTDPWHEKFAAFYENLLRVGRLPGKDLKGTLLHFNLLPLRSPTGEVQWSKAAGRTIYFAELVSEPHKGKIISIMMPSNIGLSVVHHLANSPSQRKLYAALGVTDCSSGKVCTEIVKRHQMSMQKSSLDDLLQHCELLYWYGHDSVMKLQVATQANRLSPGNAVYFTSSEEYDAQHMMQLRELAAWRQHLLHGMYQASALYSSGRCQDSLSFPEWLAKFVELRWRPRMLERTPTAKLHPAIEHVANQNPHKFLSFIQHHWTSEYAAVCRAEPKVRDGLLDIRVPCSTGQREVLRTAWFPSGDLVGAAKRWNVVDKVPLLMLKKSAIEIFEIVHWQSLAELNVRSQIGLEFYLEILGSLASDTNKITVNESKLTELYTLIGKNASLDQRGDLQARFQSKKLIYSPMQKRWVQKSLCVWKSETQLTQGLVLARSYPESETQNLFVTLLQIGDATMSHFFRKLTAIKTAHTDRHSKLSNDARIERLVNVYMAMEKIVNTEDSRFAIRNYLHKEKLIYHDSNWFSPKQCLWHASATYGGWIAIKSTYPRARAFFVGLLLVDRVEPRFMLEQLVALGPSPTSASYDDVRKLILTTGAVFAPEEEKFDNAPVALRTNRFLPCLSPQLERCFRACKDEIYVADHPDYQKAFEGKICILDFSYEELTSLHSLLQLLGLQDRYLSNHVKTRMQEVDPHFNKKLTARFRQCAYGISCYAVYARSPKYHNKSTLMHTLLKDAEVYSCADLQTKLVVGEPSRGIEACTSKVSVILRRDDGILRIYLPENQLEEKRCLRNKLPKAIVSELDIHDNGAENFISTLLNEVDQGTDEIMEAESIPHCDGWLEKTERPVPPPVQQPAQSFSNGELPESEKNCDAPHAAYLSYPYSNELVSGSTAIHVAQPVLAANSSSHAQAPISETAYVCHTHERSISVPAVVDQGNVAPDYWRVLEHVRSSAAAVASRGLLPQAMASQNTSLAVGLTELRLMQGKSSNWYAQLFGQGEMSNILIGAAGELFTFELLNVLTAGQVTFDNWPSSIRHLVRASEAYEQIVPFKGPEKADIVFKDDSERVLELRLRSGPIGDNFPGCVPPWWGSQGNGHAHHGQINEPIEWLFEVKTTLGSCDTEFTMSASQYNKMRELGSVEPSKRRQVYCLVRVYDLLQEEIGVRIYIDPWRFKEGNLQFDPTDKFRVTAT